MEVKTRNPEIQIKDEGLIWQNYLLNVPWWTMLIAGIITLAFGAAVLGWPLMAIGILVINFGILAIVFGVFGVIGSLFLIKKDKNWWILLIEGILGIIIGIMVFVWPITTTILLVYFIASWLVMTGITAIAQGGIAKNSLMIVIGILGLILGLFILFRHPLYAAETLISFIGFFAVFRGISLVVNSIIISIAQKGIKSEAYPSKS